MQGRHGFACLQRRLIRQAGSSLAGKLKGRQQTCCFTTAAFMVWGSFKISSARAGSPLPAEPRPDQW